MKKFYITTSIAYVNAAPHIGFAMELIQADALARYYRMRDSEVFFLTGTDEHGSKMAQTAHEQGITPQELADRNSEEFRSLAEFLNISNDNFIRTSSDFHKRGAQKLWRKLVSAGDIYRATYEGYYCVGCEAFVLEKDLVDGLCPNHLKKPEVLKEDNYFFRLSKYSEKIADLIESDELKVVPESRKNEILTVVGDGLTDVSFSRPNKALKWGVPVPDDETQTMYVWCDALANYITAIGYEKETAQFKKLWPAEVHLIGKDIIRFHAGIWIGMLLAAGLELPRAIYVHGFITSEGQKMSKSLGNVVDPFRIAEEYSVSALRYYLLKEISTTEDGDFSRERFHVIYNADLANSLGNLLSRVVTLTEKNCAGYLKQLEIPDSAKWRELFDESWRRYNQAFAEFDLKKALEEVMTLSNHANLFVDQKKPWVLAKEGHYEELQATLYVLLEELRQIGLMLKPFLPETAARIAAALGVSDEGDFEELLRFGCREFRVKRGEVLFPKF